MWGNLRWSLSEVLKGFLNFFTNYKLVLFHHPLLSFRTSHILRINDVIIYCGVGLFCSVDFEC